MVGTLGPILGTVQELQKKICKVISFLQTFKLVTVRSPLCYELLWAVVAQRYRMQASTLRLSGFKSRWLLVFSLISFSQQRVLKTGPTFRSNTAEQLRMFFYICQCLIALLREPFNQNANYTFLRGANIWFQSQPQSTTCAVDFKYASWTRYLRQI